MSQLNTSQQDTCIYTGVFGALLSMTCLIQHIIIAREHWITLIMLCIYLFSVIVFILLALQKSFAPMLLIVSAALVLVAELLLWLNAVISVIVMLLFLYTAVVAILLFADQYPQKLKAKALAQRAEEKEWEGKI